MGYGKRVLEGAPGVVMGEVLGSLTDFGGVEVRGAVDTDVDMERRAIEELADGDLAMEAEPRDGPEERLPGAVIILAISRPSSPMRPWTSAISSRSSPTAASRVAGSPVLCT